jgi:hypothetical protein
VFLSELFSHPKGKTYAEVSEKKVHEGIFGSKREEERGE